MPKEKVISIRQRVKKKKKKKHSIVYLIFESESYIEQNSVRLVGKQLDLHNGKLDVGRALHENYLQMSKSPNSKMMTTLKV